MIRSLPLKKDIERTYLTSSEGDYHFATTSQNYICYLRIAAHWQRGGINPYHENFNCRAPEDSGHCVDTPSAYDEAIGLKQLAKGETANTEKQIDEARLERLAQLLKEPQAPMIVPPRIVRVLILPYKGGEDLFMARYTYLQVESARWT